MNVEGAGNSDVPGYGRNGRDANDCWRCKTAIYAYYSGKNMNPYVAYGGLFIGFGLMKASDLLLLAELAGVATAGVGAAVLVGMGWL